MSDATITRRCCECGFVMTDAEPCVLTPFGWTHPACAPLEEQ